MSKYYYLIAGLPDIALDDGKRIYTVTEHFSKTELINLLKTAYQTLLELKTWDANIIDLPLTDVVDGDMVKIIAWYDNEWGYSKRV